MWPNRPESCVEVVEATTIDLSCASGGRCREQRQAAKRDERTACRHGGPPFRRAFKSASSPATNRRASSVSGLVKKVAASLASTMRPRCISTMSPASRRASPRSCVAITTLMPRAATARITSSTALVAAGSRLAVGSSRNSTCGSLASARASASRCCSPPDSLRAGRSPSSARPTSASSSRSARGAFGARHAGGGQRIAQVACGAAPEHHRPLEHDGAAVGRRVRASAPGHAPARSGGSGPWRAAAAWSCRRRSARSRRSARRRASARSIRSRIVTPRTANDDVVEQDRQIG